MTRVKVCGITGETDRDAAVAAGADALGFVVDVPVETPREVAPPRAATLVGGVPPFVTSVLVTMPDVVDEAVRLQRTVGADAVQVHATLDPPSLAALRERVGASVVAGVPPDGDLRAYAEAVDALLVDSLGDDGGGGTGETHDWERTRESVAGLDVPVVLAGGLTPANVREAVETVGPFAVDAASGVERQQRPGGSGRQPGQSRAPRTASRMDHDAVRRFVANARGAVSP